MTIVSLRRAYEKKGATLGILSIDNMEHLPIFTLEDSWVGNINYVSRIPAGSYNVEMLLSPKYGKCYHVLNVDNRDNILIHGGNTSKDTTGCVLLGLMSGVLNNVPAVLNSQKAIKSFKKLLNNKPFILKIYDLTGNQYNVE